MRKIALLSVAVAATFAALLPATPAQALFTMTFVATSGNDGNDCSRPRPCATFTRAVSQTFEGGVVSCLDSGPYGFDTIAGSVTIDCAGGVVMAFAGQTALTINGAGINVTLRNMTIHSSNPSTPAAIGINFVNGNALFVEKCTIRAFNTSPGNGISFAPSSGVGQLYVLDSVIEGNGTTSGNIGGGGIIIQPTGSGSARVVIDRTRVESNIHGILADGTGSNGSIVVQVRDSVVAGNAGNGMWAKRAGMVVDRTSSSNNAGYGMLADGAGSVIHLGNSTVAGNGGGLGATSGGKSFSYQNNQASGNAFEGGPTDVLQLK